MDWVDILQRDINDLLRQVETFLTGYIPIGSMAQDELDVVDGVKDWKSALSQRMTDLSLHQGEWTFQEVSVFFYDVFRSLNGFQSHLDVLALVRDEHGPDHDTTWYPTLSQALNDALSDLWFYDEEPWIRPPYRLFAVFSPFSTRAPARIAAGLRQFPSTETYRFDDSPLEDWPLVDYHPYYVEGLLYSLSRSPILGWALTPFSLNRTPDFFEISFTHRALHLTPQIWETLLASLSTLLCSHWLEILHEMGGQIEPLTWNEGQGEGVIVRLPWAQ